jgi:16S rRNA (adenine1518-N6/adenine1519-N6)-dimethyltransferase
VTPLPDPVVDGSEEEGYRVFVQGAFGFRRKQMRRVLRTLADIDAPTAEAALAAAGVDPDARPETLSAEQLANVWRAAGRPITTRGS